MITWDLIRTYAMQAQHLLGALGVAPRLAGPRARDRRFALSGSCIAATGRATGAFRRRAHEPRLATAVVLLGIGIVAAELFRFTQEPQAAAREPIALTFFPQWGAQRGQSSMTEGSPVLDRREAELSADYAPAADHVRRNVVLIVGDALRADRMPIYGYPRPTTPNIVRLMRRTMPVRRG